MAISHYGLIKIIMEHSRKDLHSSLIDLKTWHDLDIHLDADVALCSST